MQAGRLHHTITVQQQTTTTDSVGDAQGAWASLITARAEIRPLSARELFAAQAGQAEATHIVTIRYRPELAAPVSAAQYRVLFGSRVFDVHGVVNVDQADREIRLLCSEGLSNG